jgi:hypothetical protein
MTMPDDPLGRKWVELSQRDDAVIGLRRSLVSFLAFDHDRVPSIAGTGFIVHAGNGWALVLPARHVVTEGVYRGQTPRPPHAESAFFVTAPRIHLDARRLRGVWGEPPTAYDALRFSHANYLNENDLACCIVHPQAQEGITFGPVYVPLDPTVPCAGETLALVSMGGQFVEERERGERDGTGQQIAVGGRVVVRRGTVTGVYMGGYRQYKWPCFTVSAPSEPGMSGGFVSRQTSGQVAAAMGIICADNSESDAATDFTREGETVAALSWVALSLRMPARVPWVEGQPTFTLHQMMRDGHLPMPITGIDHVEAIDLGGVACKISIAQLNPR